MAQGPMIGLKIMLSGGGEISDVMPLTEAMDIMTRWKNGNLEALSATIGRDSTIPGDGRPWSWCVRTVEIAGMHTFNITVQQPGYAPNQGGGLPPGASGWRGN